MISEHDLTAGFTLNFSSKVDKKVAKVIAAVKLELSTNKYIYL